LDAHGSQVLLTVLLVIIGCKQCAAIEKGDTAVTEKGLS